MLGLFSPLFDTYMAMHKHIYDGVTFFNQNYINKITNKGCCSAFICKITFYETSACYYRWRTILENYRIFMMWSCTDGMQNQTGHLTHGLVSSSLGSIANWVWYELEQWLLTPFEFDGNYASFVSLQTPTKLKISFYHNHHICIHRNEFSN